MSNQHTLRRALGLNDFAEWPVVISAAKDAHMPVREYCRLMVLSAAGLGGVCEHLARANDASFHADQSPGLKVTVKR